MFQTLQQKRNTVSASLGLNCATTLYLCLPSASTPTLTQTKKGGGFAESLPSFLARVSSLRMVPSSRLAKET